MKIVKSTFTGPDSDGDMSFDVEASIENTTESIIELVKTSSFLINSQGIAVAGSFDDEEDVFIDPGETANIDVRCGWGVNSSGFEGVYDKIKAVVDAQLYRREFHILGVIDVPSDHKKANFINKGVDIAGMVKILGASCVRTKPDDDSGDVSIEVTVGVRNTSDTYFERVTAKLMLIDKEGAEFETTEDYSYLPPHSAKLLKPNCWNIKPGRLRNSKAKVTIYVYQPVEYEVGNAVFVKE
jgi:hypothetical protein